MEWNADDFTATRIVGQSTYKDILKAADFNNPKHGLWMIAIAQVVTYSLIQIGLENREPYDYKEGRHLPLRFRLECILHTMAKAYEEFSGEKLTIKVQMGFVEAAKKLKSGLTCL